MFIREKHQYIKKFSTESKQKSRDWRVFNIPKIKQSRIFENILFYWKNFFCFEEYSNKIRESFRKNQNSNTKFERILEWRKHSFLLRVCEKNTKNFPEHWNFLKKIRKKFWNNYVKAAYSSGCDFGTPCDETYFINFKNEKMKKIHSGAGMFKWGGGSYSGNC